MRFTDVEPSQPEDDFWNCSECQVQHESALFPHKVNHAHNGHVTWQQSRIKPFDSDLPINPIQQCNTTRTTDSNEDEEVGMAPFHVNHYATLGLSISANQREVLEAYRRRLDRLQRRCQTSSPSTALPRQTTLREAAKSSTDNLQAQRSYTEDNLPAQQQALSSSVFRTTNYESIRQTYTTHTLEEVLYARNLNNIVRTNEIEDALQMLGHPHKKQLYDLVFLPALESYQQRRRQQRSQRQAKQQPTGGRVQNGRISDAGRDGERKVNAAEDSRVENLGGFDVNHHNLVTASMACGEVVAGFIDGMEL